MRALRSPRLPVLAWDARGGPSSFLSALSSSLSALSASPFFIRKGETSLFLLSWPRFPDRRSPRGSFPDFFFFPGAPQTEARGAGARATLCPGATPRASVLSAFGAGRRGPREHSACGWGRWSARLGLFARCRPRRVPCPWRLLGAIPVSLIETRLREGVEQETRRAKRVGRGRELGGQGTRRGRKNRIERGPCRQAWEGGGGSPPRGAARGLLF